MYIVHILFMCAYRSVTLAGFCHATAMCLRVAARVFTKVTFGISRKLKFYTKMVLFSRNFEQFRIFSYYFLYDISYNLA